MDKIELDESSYWADLNKATNAMSIGSGLSAFNSIIHTFAFAALIVFSLYAGMKSLSITLPVGVGLLFSWAIIYSLLSLVVTNALTAKHTIILSSYQECNDELPEGLETEPDMSL